MCRGSDPNATGATVDRDACTESGGVWEGVSPPQPTRECGGNVVSSQSVIRGIPPAANAFSVYSRPQNASRRKKKCDYVIMLSKLLYASPAWWGFTNAADKQRLEASVRRAICTPPTIPRRLNWLPTWTITFSRTYSITLAMFYTNFFRTKQVIAIISDLVVTLCH